MLKTILLILLGQCLFLSLPAQCIVPPSPPDCNGSEPLIADGDVLGTGTTKFYYGATAAINSLTVDGGTLVICGDITIDKFYMNTGKIFVRPGARLVIGSGIGAGLQFKGDCAIYNYGTCEIQRNLTLENNATAGAPNVVVNALGSSVFKMSNQYFVINNAHSWFVNNGRAEFWGIITDPQTPSGAVCLGMSSTTTMSVLINKVANTYQAPNGNACLRVAQYSEFYGRLSDSPSLFVCLGSGHSSNAGCIPFGCAPNNWGSAQVFTNCAGCAALAVLPIRFSSFVATSVHATSVELAWSMDKMIPGGKFMVMRSGDGEHYTAIDSIQITNSDKANYSTADNHPMNGNNFYMIQYTNPQTGKPQQSNTLKVVTETATEFNVYPVPFEEHLFIDFPAGTTPEKILLTDLTGRNVRTMYLNKPGSSTVKLKLLDKVNAGLYILHIQTNRNIVAKTIFKR